MEEAPRVKICCIQSVDEARLAINFGASALGLVSAMPSGFGPIPESLIAEIAGAVPPPVETFLLTCRQDSAGIVRQLRRCRCGTVQICDRLVSGAYSDVRDAIPGIHLVQVIHVTGKGALDEALSAAEHVDALLLDSGDPSREVKELGGTGRRHDWSISAAICAQSPVPVYLAGGLNPDNVRDAIETVRPFGLDVCTGVRTGGRLDPHKLRAFMSGALRNST
jgi:phosphoribosylanthranilate isomerase